MKILGREPAVLIGVAGAVIKLLAAFGVGLTADQQALLNAAVVAGVGLWVASRVHDGVPAAITGFTQAGLALAVGFGLHWSADKQAVVMALVSGVVAIAVRQASTPATKSYTPEHAKQE